METSAFIHEMTFATFVLNILSSLSFTGESVARKNSSGKKLQKVQVFNVIKCNGEACQRRIPGERGWRVEGDVTASEMV